MLIEIRFSFSKRFSFSFQGKLQGAYNWMNFFGLQVDGPITEGFINGGETYKRQFTVFTSGEQIT